MCPPEGDEASVAAKPIVHLGPESRAAAPRGLAPSAALRADLPQRGEKSAAPALFRGLGRRAR
jgi:hypothetical protein